MTDPFIDVRAVLELLDNSPPPDPLECHTTPTGFAALRAFLATEDWTERIAGVAALPPGLGGIMIYEDPGLTGERVEFRRSDGTVVAGFDLSGEVDS